MLRTGLNIFVGGLVLWLPTRHTKQYIQWDTFPQVDEEDIEEMFSYADKDKDGKISYLEFQAMINPPKPPTEPAPSLTPTPVKRVTIKTTEKDEDLVDIIDTDLLADAEDKLMTPVTTK